MSRDQRPVLPISARQAERHRPALPPVLPGFEHINRYWDPVHRIVAVKLLPGEYYVTRNDELLVTVLGSCVSACIRDPVAAVGGMNHFMLPVKNPAACRPWGGGGEGAGDEANRYGCFAMERLINEILKHGGVRARLEVKLVGGGRVLAHMPDIGQRNIEFALRYVQTEGLKLLAADLGDIYPRKLYFYPATGRVRVLKLRSLHNDTLLVRERRYRQQLESSPPGGEVEWFESYDGIAPGGRHAPQDQGPDR